MVNRASRLEKTVHSHEQATFRALIIATRKKSGLTQSALARRLKKPQSFIAKYEGGERRLDILELIAVTRAMDVDPVQFFKNLVREINS